MTIGVIQYAPNLAGVVNKSLFLLEINMKDNMLEVGDEIFRYVGFSQKGMMLEGKIDRVTKTLAFIGTLKLKRYLCMGSTSRPGDHGYSYTCYHLVTDENREEIKAQNIRRALIKPLITMIDGGRGSINHLSNDQLKRINAILSEATK